jgi:hypothetical protein
MDRNDTRPFNYTRSYLPQVTCGRYERVELGLCMEEVVAMQWLKWMPPSKCIACALPTHVPNSNAED